MTRIYPKTYLMRLSKGLLCFIYEGLLMEDGIVNVEMKSKGLTKDEIIAKIVSIQSQKLRKSKENMFKGF